MHNSLPAVVIGGPPNAGKSVLLYNITYALRERGIRHHAIRACPDGEGNWFHEGDAKIVSHIRANAKGHWSPSFVQRISFTLQHRCLPFLVDMGGKPTPAELPLFRECTHSVLLLRTDQPVATEQWLSITTRANLLPLAQLFSQLTDPSTITSHSLLLEGTITGLQRQQKITHDPVFAALIDRIAALFESYAPEELERIFLQQAPGEYTINLYDALCQFTTSTEWDPAMLAPLLNSLPAQTPLAVYGVGPNWLYAALAVHTGQQPFYQFDPQLPFGWIEPLPVTFGPSSSPDIAIHQRAAEQATVLSISFPIRRLEYFQPDPLAFPPVFPEHGLILDGPLPFWLLTALARLYSQSDLPWIAVHYIRLHHAIVIYSRIPTRHVGDLIPFPSE